MRIIQRRHQVEHVSYSRAFEYLTAAPGSRHGFSFPSTSSGHVDTTKLPPAAAENFRKCLSGELPVRDCGVERETHAYTEPAIGLCDDCRAEVVLDGFTCSCDCGADYNSSGQRLAPRSQWGEETGETAADLLHGGL